MVKKRVSKEIKGAVKNYVRRLSEQEKLPIDRVIIFGSHAKGKAHRFSDIDVCIISPRFKDAMKALEFLLIKRNDEDVKLGLEPVGFSNKDFQEGSSLLQEIKRTGVVLY